MTNSNDAKRGSEISDLTLDEWEIGVKAALKTVKLVGGSEDDQAPFEMILKLISALRGARGELRASREASSRFRSVLNAMEAALAWTAKRDAVVPERVLGTADIVGIKDDQLFRVDIETKPEGKTE